MSTAVQLTRKKLFPADTYTHAALPAAGVIAVSLAGTSPQAIMESEAKLHAAYKIVIRLWNVASAVLAFVLCSFYLVIRYVTFELHPVSHMYLVIIDNTSTCMGLTRASV